MHAASPLLTRPRARRLAAAVTPVHQNTDANAHHLKMPASCTQLNNVIIMLLFAAAIVEGGLQSWAEFGLILGVIAINTAIGMVQVGQGRGSRSSRSTACTLASAPRARKRGAVTAGWGTP